MANFNSEYRPGRSSLHTTGNTFFQAKLTVNDPGDVHEKEADATAGGVTRMSQTFIPKKPVAVTTLQRKCAHCEEEEKNMQRKAMDAEETTANNEIENYIGNISGGGHSMPEEVRNFYEPRLGYDFSNVKLHTDAAAARSAKSIHALAYTSGNNIVFNHGQYSPQTDSGKKLLAHELTHVVQQGSSISTSIQRDCDDPEFCTPYPTAAEAASAESTLRSVYLPSDEATFGPDSRRLYQSFLDRSPGDSLSPVLFNNPANAVVDSFATSGKTADDQDAVIDMVGNRLSRAPGWPLRDNTPTMMSLANFLSPAEMDNRSINYSNPFSIAGHIAGGIGSSDAGADYRKINYGNVTLEKVPIIGSTGYVTVETTLQYEIFDAIDFCPGDCGAPHEQIVTIPMSRLEAGGQAYDVPFKVNFTAPSRSKRFWNW